MATTSALNINIRGPEEVVAQPMGASQTVYHGAFAAVSSSGYVINPTTGTNLAYGIVKSQYLNDSTQNPKGLYSSVQGSIADNTSIVDLYIGGYVDHIPFTAVAVTDVGKSVYLTDNNTAVVTTSAPGFGPVGKVSKYFSATKAEIKLNGLQD